MRKVNITFCILLQFICILYANANNTSNVVTLNDDNFWTKIKESNLVLVKFYAPWCGHCYNFAPTFIKLADEIKNRNIPAILGEVDCTTQIKTCSSNNIQYYPTVKLFKNGKFEAEFRGSRTVENLIDFVKQHI
jgi:protein disulfide-isomerase A1